MHAETVELTREGAEIRGSGRQPTAGEQQRLWGFCMSEHAASVVKTLAASWEPRKD